MTLQMWLKNFLKKTKIAIAFEFYFCFIKVNGAIKLLFMEFLDFQILIRLNFNKNAIYAIFLFG